MLGRAIVGASPFTNVFVAFGRSTASHHSALDGPDFEIRPGLLHLAMPFPLCLGSDEYLVQAEPHFHGPASLGPQSMVCRPADAVAKTELREGVCDPFK